MSVNWIRLGKEIGSMPNGIAVLRLLQAHGINQLTEIRLPEGKIGACCSVEMVIDYAHKEK